MESTGFSSMFVFDFMRCGNLTKQVEKGLLSGLVTERHKVSCSVMLASIAQTFCFGIGTVQLLVRSSIQRGCIGCKGVF